jgi:hypothetical protein
VPAPRLLAPDGQSDRTDPVHPQVLRTLTASPVQFPPWSSHRSRTHERPRWIAKGRPRRLPLMLSWIPSTSHISKNCTAPKPSVSASSGKSHRMASDLMTQISLPYRSLLLTVSDGIDYSLRYADISSSTSCGPTTRSAPSSSRRFSRSTRPSGTNREARTATRLWERCCGTDRLGSQSERDRAPDAGPEDIGRCALSEEQDWMASERRVQARTPERPDRPVRGFSSL